ncbi:MAG: phosphate propanoyltransferase [Armatimonadota bacterium]
MDEKIIKEVVDEVVNKISEQTKVSPAGFNEYNIPIGVSNRHLHVSREDLDILFGQGYSLTNIKDLSQPGQFACEETVTLIGPKGVKEKVRILGPVRKNTQVEISITDSYQLGVSPAVRESGDIEGTPGISVSGPRGVVKLEKGAIIAKRHIHMTPEEADLFGVRDKQVVAVEIAGPRKLIFDNVIVRISKDFKLDLHIDTDEANAAAATTGMRAKLIK